MNPGEAAFWIALLQIIGVNLLLSGDNAIVIALSARSLPPRQQRLAIFWGSFVAVVLRVILTVVALQLMQLPYLKLVGAALLGWIAVKLLIPEPGGRDVKSSDGLWTAIRTILLADLAMSVDNVIGVAAVAKDNVVLLALGLAISIPLVIFGSTLLLKLMRRLPIIITLGAALLGWVTGDMMVTDPLVKSWIAANAAYLTWVVPALGVVVVVIIGRVFAKRVLRKRS